MLDLSFQKGANIIVGENNAGKSSIIDALRICLSFGKQIKDIGIRNDEDFYINISDINDCLSPIEFDLYFKIEKEIERSVFNSLKYQDPDNADYQDLRVYFKYFLEEKENGNKVLRLKLTGGGMDGVVNYEELQELYYTYLAPLRDAEKELRPYVKENKLTSLFNKLTSYNICDDEGNPTKKKLDQSEKDKLANKLQAVIRDSDWSGLITTGTEIVNDHLAKADIKRKEAKINIQLLEYKYENIIKGILTRFPVYPSNVIQEQIDKQRYFDVSQNGLGDNNLIYAASILSDLNNRDMEKIESYYALFIEEPEAHLHPQKQNTFFNYLDSLKDSNIQIFITSHSPTITAKSNLDNIVVLQKRKYEVCAFSIKNSILTPSDKKYLSKFLDVTKSQLFFSNGVILVEGISEALLLPILAKRIGENYDLDKNGIEIVNIGGVAFDPFINLFNTTNSSKRMAIRCVALSDNDKHTTDNREISPRANKLIANKVKDSNLDIYIAEYTFEYELVTKSKKNADIIQSIYSLMHPQTSLKDGNNLHERALELLEKLKSNKDKSELAQRLAIHLDENSIDFAKFEIPIYIENAIKWVIDTE